MNLRKDIFLLFIYSFLEIHFDIFGIQSQIKLNVSNIINDEKPFQNISQTAHAFNTFRLNVFSTLYIFNYENGLYLA